ncbi:hypothetical protein M422DRAFT_261728 [Sphaerobolus stellatus SS14]|uniref:Uncharacterized protein n=1 Tax=Sphaerobolus stellatus (strain SS14) TaxID=990650 RepID=A0A0C9VEX6_SPHS4|nr:hypothetical protein M422DRAFT_261728 [Sphaerobolus stellatus SS14]
MLFKSVLFLAAFVSIASAWEIFLFEPQAGGADARNCQAGGTTVSGTTSTCIEDLAARNIESAQVISDNEGCAFEMWDGTNCSGTQNNGQGANFCFNALPVIGYTWNLSTTLAMDLGCRPYIEDTEDDPYYETFGEGQRGIITDSRYG